MTFRFEVLAIFLGDVLASLLFVLGYGLFQWFLRATDIRIGYNWSWEGSNLYPNFHIRNRSRTQTYLLGNISYTKDKGTTLVAIDNESIWGKELKPGSISLLRGGAVKGCKPPLA